jgi:hypothetical protein
VGYELRTGAAVVLYLQNPREKVWGLLLSLTTAGVLIRGLDLAVFEDWMRQEARNEEPLLGLCTVFYPMTRVERLERDEAVGSFLGCADRFALEVGRSVWQVVGIPPEE